MRRARLLLPLAIVLIGAAVYLTYQSRRRTQAAEAPPAPRSLPGEVTARAQDWRWAHTVGGKPIVEVRARNFSQAGGRMDLDQVELRLYHKGASVFDRVTSAKAEFRVSEGVLYAEGDVEIRMAEPVEGERKGRLVVIHTSGVRFESQSGRASTDREARFEFDDGEGRAIGAAYDPNTRELHLRKSAQVTWRGRGPAATPLTVEGDEILYFERDSLVRVSPWSRFRRGTLLLEAATAVIRIQEGAIERVEAPDAKGRDSFPNRELQYGARHLTLHFGPKSVVSRIVGDQDAWLLSRSQTARTAVRAARVDLDFAIDGNESILQRALASGKAHVEAEPVRREGVPAAETRVVDSEFIELRMRPGGREIAAMETHAPGRVEFRPNRAGQRFRILDGERLWITYGERNQIQQFRAVQAHTRTRGLPRPGAGPAEPDMLTWSRDLLADFDPAGGDLQTLEQWNDFRYEKGSQRAWAERARFDAPRNLVILTGRARLADPTGSATADRIELAQNTNEFIAEGNVTSTRLPDPKASQGTLLSDGEAVHARAQRMVSRDDNRKLRYEGGAVLWQGANRIEGRIIDIDRAQKTIRASGGVVSQFADQPAKPPAPDGLNASAGPPATVLTLVQAGELLYTDRDRLAHYQGGSQLTRPGLLVRGREIRAILKKEAHGTSLERAFADGEAEIVQTSAGRTRKGTGEHAVYDVAEERVTLTGGSPLLVDSVRGDTRGLALTYFAGSDRLLVNGQPARPSASRIQRQPR